MVNALIFFIFTLCPAYSRVGREPSVKTLRALLSAGFWRHYVLGGGNKRRALPRHQSEEMKI